MIEVELISYCAIIPWMGKHDKTLAAVFADPVRANVRRADVEALFEHLGATIENRQVLGCM
jgi:hypothetical protein